MTTKEALQAIYDVLEKELDVVNLAAEQASTKELDEAIKEALDELNMEDLYMKYNELSKKRVEECYVILKEKLTNL